jgi:hypothetical protein
VSAGGRAIMKKIMKKSYRVHGKVLS